MNGEWRLIIGNRKTVFAEHKKNGVEESHKKTGGGRGIEFKFECETHSQ